MGQLFLFKTSEKQVFILVTFQTTSLSNSKRLIFQINQQSNKVEVQSTFSTETKKTKFTSKVLIFSRTILPTPLEEQSPTVVKVSNQMA